MSTGKPEFIRLGELVFEEDGWGIGNLATAIERHGIWGADRFGRHVFFPAPETADRARKDRGVGSSSAADASHVLDLLAAEEQAREAALAEALLRMRGGGSLEMPVFELNWQLMRFGWAPEQLPDFAAIDAERNPQTPPQFPDADELKAANAKATYSLLRLIGAMLHIMAGDVERQLKPHPLWEKPGDPDAFDRVLRHIAQRWHGRSGLTPATISKNFKLALEALDKEPGQRPGLIAKGLPDRS